MSTHKGNPTYMNDLDTIALTNIKCLSRHKDETERLGWVVDDVSLQRLDDPSIDSGLTPSSLEYPLFLTFQRLLDFLREDNRVLLGSHTNREVLYMMEEALQTCYHIVEEFPEDADTSRLSLILQEIDDHHSVIYEWYHRDRLCHKVSLWMVETFDQWVMSFAECRKYLYLPDVGGVLDTESDSESDSESKKEC
jgi:hypothetical protein